MEKPRAALDGGRDRRRQRAASSASKAVLEARGTDHNTHPVGSGPLQVASFEKQRGVTLKRSPTYPGTRKPGSRRLRSATCRTRRPTELGLRSGELDFALLPPQSAEPLRKCKPASSSPQQPGIANVWIGLNIQKKPFDDIRVRKAFRLALDVGQMLLAGYNGQARPARTALIMPQVHRLLEGRARPEA